MSKKIQRGYNEAMTVDMLDNLFRSSYEKTQEELCPERVVRLSRVSDLSSNNIEKLKKSGKENSIK